MYLGVIVSLHKGDICTARDKIKVCRNLIQVSLKQFSAEIANDEDNEARFLWPEMADALDCFDIINRTSVLLSQNSDPVKIFNQIVDIQAKKRFGLISLVEEHQKRYERVCSDNAALLSQSIVDAVLRKIQQIKTNKLALWGLSPLSEMLYKRLKENGDFNFDLYYIDSDVGLNGYKYLDKRVCSLEDANSKYGIDTIIICSIASEVVIRRKIPDGYNVISVKI